MAAHAPRGRSGLRHCGPWAAVWRCGTPWPSGGRRRPRKDGTCDVSFYPAAGGGSGRRSGPDRAALERADGRAPCPWHRAGPADRDRAILATHHGLFALDLATGTVRPLGASRDDFIGHTPVPGQPKQAFVSGRPATGGNLGTLRGQGGGQSWQHIAARLADPVDFHNMEVSRADPSVIYGASPDGLVQRSGDSGAGWGASAPRQSG